MKSAYVLMCIIVLGVSACQQSAGVDRPNDFRSTEKITITSAAMHRSHPAWVILPENYPADSARRFPVVYMLHGHGGSCQQWLDIRPDLPDLATRYQTVLVLPDGYHNSWYLDSPHDAAYQYATYLTEDVVSAIDARYRTIAAAQGRAITGLSMGGHGALLHALRRPDLFGAAGSTSGGLDIRQHPHRWQLTDRLGDADTAAHHWTNNSVQVHLDRVDPDLAPAMIVDCGWADFFYNINQTAHQRMQQRGIDHVYLTRSGGHTPAYWAAALPQHLAFFRQYFDQP